MYSYGCIVLVGFVDDDICISVLCDGNEACKEDLIGGWRGGRGMGNCSGIGFWIWHGSVGGFGEDGRSGGR
jgi:hypothetical protein